MDFVEVLKILKYQQKTEIFFNIKFYFMKLLPVISCDYPLSHFVEVFNIFGIG
jgi:hypothetical protein